MINENDIKKYFNNFSEEEIANSVYLYGLDFENDSFDNILDSVAALYDEVNTLNDIIVSRFENNEGKVLTKEQSAVQYNIIQDYQKKSSILKRILMNDNVYEAVESRIFEIENKKRSESSR